MNTNSNPFAQVPPSIRLGQRLSRLASEVGDLSVEIVGAIHADDRRMLAQRLRALADSVETAEG